MSKKYWYFRGTHGYELINGIAMEETWAIFSSYEYIPGAEVAVCESCFFDDFYVNTGVPVCKKCGSSRKAYYILPKMRWKYVHL